MGIEMKFVQDKGSVVLTQQLTARVLVQLGYEVTRTDADETIICDPRVPEAEISFKKADQGVLVQFTGLKMFPIWANA